MKKGIIIPDVHGRTFWRDAVRGNEEARIVFLGDYLDPYPHEGITPEKALSEFKAILQFKKEHPDNVTLLLGNHDLGYIDWHICDCRHDYLHEIEINALFRDNLDFFDLCTQETISSGKKVLFSHAGLHPDWVKEHPELFPAGQFDAAKLNSQFHVEAIRDKVLAALSDVSYYRGGWNTAGSLVWADIREYNGITTDIFQIVGHTQVGNSPQIFDNVICVDCHRAFSLNLQ